MQGEVKLRYIQDISERRRILHACHVERTAGHLGRTRTFHRIKERFMWHGMLKDVTEMVCQCNNNQKLCILCGRLM